MLCVARTFLPPPEGAGDKPVDCLSYKSRQLLLIYYYLSPLFYANLTMKKILSAVLLCSIAFSLCAQPRKKVGVVLSGGGAKGVAHIGALKVIEEAGIPVDVIVGTSMGSIVGGLYAIGYTPGQLDSLVRKQDWSFVLTDRTTRRQKTFVEKTESDKYLITLPLDRFLKERIPDGIVRGRNINKLFTDLTVGYHDSIDFNKLPIPYAAVAVDLIAGKEVVFHSGNLAEVMRASMAIPAAFSPVRKDSMVLVDGGLLNNFPVDVARAMGAEIVIGIDVRSDPEGYGKALTLIDMVNKLTDMSGSEKYDRNVADTDLYIKVDVSGYNAASFDEAALDTLIARGERAARGQWSELIDIRQRIGLPEDFRPPTHGPYDLFTAAHPIYVRQISFQGINRKDARKLLKKADVLENSYVTSDKLADAVDRLYSLQSFTNIRYNLKEVVDGYDLEFIMEDHTPNLFHLGVRFDTEEVAAVQLAAAYQWKTSIPTMLAFTGRIGKRASARLDYRIMPGPLRFVNLSYMFQYNDLNLYHEGRRAYNTTYRVHLAELGYANILNRDFKYGFGLRYEYYDYSSFLFNTTEANVLTVHPEGFFSYYATIQYETKNKKTFPTSGMSLLADVSVYTDNLSNYNSHAPFTALSLWWESAFRLTNRFYMLPSFYGRVLIGEEVAYPYLNVMGGRWAGHYVAQQIPFVGINNIEVFDNSVLVGQLELRQRMGKNHYLSLNSSYGLSNNDLEDILKGRHLFGIGIGYGYDSLFGPIEASLSISNRTNKFGFMASIGYTF